MSDRAGRRLPIVLGFALNIAFYLGMTFSGHFALIVLVAIVAGIGNALVMPALSAFYLDLSSEDHRSRVMGLKESAAALGAVGGPLAVALVSGWMTASHVFMTTAVLMVAAAVIALVALPARRQHVPALAQG